MLQHKLATDTILIKLCCHRLVKIPVCKGCEHRDLVVEQHERDARQERRSGCSHARSRSCCCCRPHCRTLRNKTCCSGRRVGRSRIGAALKRRHSIWWLSINGSSINDVTKFCIILTLLHLSCPLWLLIKLITVKYVTTFINDIAALKKFKLSLCMYLLRQGPTEGAELHLSAFPFTTLSSSASSRNKTKLWFFTSVIYNKTIARLKIRALLF